jgi:serine/threonine-protein kinase RsbW
VREIVSLAPQNAAGRSLLVQAAPMAGASELLRQAFDDLFNGHRGAAPVYFAFSRRVVNLATAARRFLQTFLTQVVAYRRDDAQLIFASPSMGSIRDLASTHDLEWIGKLIADAERAAVENDESDLMQLAFGAPREAAARGIRTLVMLDDLHLADRHDGSTSFSALVASTLAQSGTPFVLSGLRRHLSGLLDGAFALNAGVRKLHLDYLSDVESRALIETLSERHGLRLNEETRDLVIQQFEGNPYFIASILQSARDCANAVESFADFQRIYVDQLLGGAIHQRYATLLEEIAPSVGLRRDLLRVLHESATSVGGKVHVEGLAKRSGIGERAVELVLKELHAHELVGLHSTYVEAAASRVWRDFLRVSYRLNVAIEPRALVYANTLMEALKRAPQTMARFYRREAAMRLDDLLGRFDSQKVPASLLHNDQFVRAYRGAAPDEVTAGLEAETKVVQLPKVVHVSSCQSFSTPFAEFCDDEQCWVAHGFDSGTYTEANEVVWLAVEIDSKLEASRALTEVWLDRLAEIARACDFKRVRPWLLSAEGFSTDSCELLNERGAFGTSRQQFELLQARLGARAAESQADSGEFEMVIPMGEDTELIAARTVEQIARRLDFDPEAINQIKTALVEACINAAEHSLSNDRKIYQRFRVESDKLTVTVSSRGRAIPPGADADHNNGNELAEKSAERRGWGLKLIRTLMDEVEFEPVDDGTRLRMTKYLRK